MTGQNGQVARISPGKFRQLGPVNWLVAKLAARAVGAPQMHLFTTLGYRQYLFWTFAIYTGRLLHGRLPGVDTELVILGSHTYDLANTNFSIIAEWRAVGA